MSITLPSLSKGSNDVFLVILFTFFALLLDVKYRILETLHHLTMGYDGWLLERALSLSLVSFFSLTTLAIVRGRRLKGEIVRREVSENLARSLARHDPLTGLPNRRLLTEQLASATVRTAASGKHLAVLLIDLDRFKPVNDVYGHAAGDIVLSVIADRMHRLSEAGSGILLARLGGDEFACVLEYEAGTDAPIRLAKQVVHLAELPIDIGPRKVEIGASIGISAGPGGAIPVEELLRMADVAMYRAKREGRGTFRSFEEQMDAELRQRAVVEADLREGLPRGEVVPYFQPILALPGHELIGFEALARWNHPTRGLIPPDDFISIAEDCQLIDQLFFSLLARACDDASAWPAHLSLAVNLSPVQLSDPWLAQRVLKALTEAGFAPGRLTVELTESAIVDDLAAAQAIIASLKSAGVKVALDDFGTGYSSLAHLRTLQFDSIKIDRSFVKDMQHARDGELVRAIIGMGHSLGMPVTAEGVETAGDLSALAELECNQVQGYLLGRPASASDVLAWLANGGPVGEVQIPARRAAGTAS